MIRYNYEYCGFYETAKNVLHSYAILHIYVGYTNILKINDWTIELFSYFSVH